MCNEATESPARSTNRLVHLAGEDPKSPSKKRRDIFLQWIITDEKMLPGSNEKKIRHSRPGRSRAHLLVQMELLAAGDSPGWEHLLPQRGPGLGFHLTLSMHGSGTCGDEGQSSHRASPIDG